MSRITLFCLIMIFFLDCNKDSNEIDCSYDKLLEIKFYDGGENVSSDFKLDSIGIGYGCNITPRKTIPISHTDTSLIYGIKERCCQSVDFIYETQRLVVTYGNFRNQIADIDFKVDVDTVNGVTKCQIIEVLPDSNSYQAELIQDRVILKIIK